MKQALWREGWGAALLDLCACIAGFGLAALSERLWLGDDYLLRPNLEVVPWIVTAVVAWLALIFPESQWHEGVRLWIDGFLSVVGTNLLVQCGLTYMFGFLPASWFIMVMGSLLSIAGTAALRKWWTFGKATHRNGTLLAGFDELTAPLTETLQQQIIGLAGNPLPPGSPALPVLGGLDRLNEICEAKRPASVVVSGVPAGITFAQLLHLHYSGIEIESAPFLYERSLHRVAWQYLRPSDLLFSLNPNTSRAMLAFQAIYKNLLGLTLRLLSAPVLMLTSAFIVISTKGAALEHIECLGYQQTPFQLLRFRIRQADGSLSRVGKLIAKLHLTNLPQIINVVRGEMALFGPTPVRTVFAERLNQLLPAYVYRFTVKPGIFDWYRANLAKTNVLPEEMLRLEYDLYYIKQESPSLDLDILLCILLRQFSAKHEPATVLGIARNC